MKTVTRRALLLLPMTLIAQLTTPEGEKVPDTLRNRLAIVYNQFNKKAHDWAEAMNVDRDPHVLPYKAFKAMQEMIPLWRKVEKLFDNYIKGIK